MRVIVDLGGGFPPAEIHTIERPVKDGKGDFVPVADKAKADDGYVLMKESAESVLVYVHTGDSNYKLIRIEAEHIIILAAKIREMERLTEGCIDW